MSGGFKSRLSLRALPALLTVVVLLVGMLGWMWLGLEPVEVLDKVRQLQAVLNAHAPWVAGGLALVFALSVGFGLPGGSVFVLLAGYLFGVGGGLLLSLVAGLAGGLITLGLVRLAGWRVENHQYLPLAWVNRHPFWLLFILRNVPVLPFTLVSMVGGMMRLPIRGYALATVLGSVPTMGLLAIMGHRLSVHIWQPALPSVEEILRDPGVWGPGLLLAMLALVAGLFRRHFGIRS